MIDARSASSYDPRSQTAADEVTRSQERVVLGWFLTAINAEHAAEEVDLLEPRHFHYPPHEHIYDAITQTAGAADAYLRVLDLLIKPQAPRALNMLDSTLAVYLTECIRDADCYDRDTMRGYAQKIRDSWVGRRGRALVVALDQAFKSGDLSAAANAWAEVGTVLDAPSDSLIGEAPAYGDVAAMIAQGIPEPPQPDILHRDDMVALFYRGKVNVLFGDSESGKTWIALAALVEVLDNGGRGAFLDLDHNGMGEIVSRLLMLGAKPAELADPDRFRYCEPQDAGELEWFVTDIASWSSDVAVADSVGEILPMLGLSSNSPDDYTIGHRKVLARLADSGAAVIAIDHLPKDDGAREKGQTGTLAKKRAVNGVTLRGVGQGPVHSRLRRLGEPRGQQGPSGRPTWSLPAREERTRRQIRDD